MNALTVYEEMNGVQCPAETIKLSDKSRSIKLETVDWHEVERREEIRQIARQVILDELAASRPISERLELL
jgi:hypothetical protein